MAGDNLRELNEVAVLSNALREARQYTLALYAHLTPAQREVPYLGSVNPPVWELAHVGWFQEFWCLRYREGRDPFPTRLPGADPMLNSAVIPHRSRWNLPQLTWDGMLAYLEQVLDDVLESLQASAQNQRYFFQLALLHEDMHAEAMLMTLQTLGYPPPQMPPALPRPEPAPLSSEIDFEGGTFRLGSTPGPDFVFDNEKRAHEVEVEPFRLSAAAVTNREFLAFVEAGGYLRETCWSPEGWRWRREAGVTAPRYWRREGGHWMLRRFDAWEPVVEDEPVMHVGAHEAEAYCRFVGKRLPTEAEWEFAARALLPEHGDRFPWGDSPAAHGRVNLDGVYGRPVPARALAASDSHRGVRQMLGNVWEWTASAFAPYPGFAPDSYREYSEPWFYDHRVLRGGCFATRARLVHNRWRNFYAPERGDIFAGFRTAATPA